MTLLQSKLFEDFESGVSWTLVYNKNIVDIFMDHLTCCVRVGATLYCGDR